MKLLTRMALMLALAAGGSFAMPDSADAASPETSLCKKKKKKRAKKVKRSRKAKREKKARAPKKVTARTIKLWQKKGLTDEEIVEKATTANYEVTKRELAALKKSRVRKSLISALQGEEPEVAMAPEPKKPQAIDINKTIDPNDIDFDSVPPPSGIPERYVSKPEEKKGLDVSLRPSAPFVPKKSSEEAKNDTPRKPLVVAK